MAYKKFGYIEIDDARIDATCDAYFKWKDLNTYIKNTSSRGMNMPDAISEPVLLRSLKIKLALSELQIS